MLLSNVDTDVMFVLHLCAVLYMSSDQYMTAEAWCQETWHQLHCLEATNVRPFLYLSAAVKAAYKLSDLLTHDINYFDMNWSGVLGIWQEDNLMKAETYLCLPS